MPMAMPSPTRVRPRPVVTRQRDAEGEQRDRDQRQQPRGGLQDVQEVLRLGQPGRVGHLDRSRCLFAGSLSNTLRPVDFNLVTTRLRRSVRFSVISPLCVCDALVPRR